MRITTWNVNGMRAALKKGLHAHLEALDTDVVLFQEVRANVHQLKADAAPEGWHVLWHPGEKPGYAGVAIWSRQPPEVLETGLGGPDPEGRVLRARIGKAQVVSLYLPSGSSGAVRQAKKEVFMERLAAWMEPLAALEEPVIIGGDWNIAPTSDDLFNPTGNKKNSGFLPHERAWFQAQLDAGWTDLFRAHRGPGKGPWSWWSNRGRARELDRGWRIDHLLGNAIAAKRLRKASIRRAGGLTVSDHAPVTVDLKSR